MRGLKLGMLCIKQQYFNSLWPKFEQNPSIIYKVMTILRTCVQIGLRQYRKIEQLLITDLEPHNGAAGSNVQVPSV